MLLLLGLLVLNSAISAWNAYASGAYLTESRAIGGFARVLVWCGLIMSGCGFTWTYLTILTLGAISFNVLTVHQAQIMFQLGYLIILLPILGSGFGIWAHSVVQAYRTRKFGDIAVAGWNTYAQFHNTWEAASNAPSALKEVIGFFSSDDDDEGGGAGAVIIIVLVIMALVAGAMTTAAIARWADRKVAIDIVDARENF